jgi:hypothetical protein
MDAGGLGAIIGIGAMALGMTCFFLYEKRNRIRKLFSSRLSIQALNPTLILLPPTHAKMKNILPPLKTKVYFLNGLHSMQGSHKFSADQRV